MLKRASLLGASTSDMIYVGDSEIDAATAQIIRLEALLGGAFAERAPAVVVDKERTKLEALKSTREKLEANRKALGE